MPLIGQQFPTDQSEGQGMAGATDEEAWRTHILLRNEEEDEEKE